MGNSNPGRWNLAEVLDAIDAVGRFYGLAGWRSASGAMPPGRCFCGARTSFSRGFAAKRPHAPTWARSSPMSA